MSAPVLTELRPVTVADLSPGQTMLPGQMIFTIQTLPVETDSGPSASFWSIRLWLPEGFRSSTVENVKLVMAYIRAMDPRAGEMIDKIAAIARDPRSRRVARRHGMTERMFSPAEGAAILGTLAR